MSLDLESKVRSLLMHADKGEAALDALRGFQFVKELGRGGMGAVFLLQRDGETRALKMTLPGVSRGGQAEALFIREMEHTKALQHPNIVRLDTAGSWQETLFFTMEYCKGGSAADLAAGRLPLKAAMDIVLQVLNGLEFAHQTDIPAQLADGSYGKAHGVVHRDIKPSNILISEEGSQRIAKVADFGLSKAFEMAGLTHLTRTGDVGGTLPFMPRHQFINYRYAKPEVDVWAAAASLYWMLTGGLPRECSPGKSWGEVIRKERPVPIRNLDASITPPIASVIDAALDDSGILKYPTAADLAAALKEALAYY
jgi:serine/threonine protein kinase